MPPGGSSAQVASPPRQSSALSRSATKWLPSSGVRGSALQLPGRWSSMPSPVARSITSSRILSLAYASDSRVHLHSQTAPTSMTRRTPTSAQSGSGDGPGCRRRRPGRLSLAWSAAADAVADVGGAFGWPGVLDEDFSVGVGEHDAGLVPDGVAGLPGQLAAYLELDAVQIDVAVGLDRRFAVALDTHSDRSRDVRLRRLRTGWLGDRGGIPCLLRRHPAR